MMNRIDKAGVGNRSALCMRDGDERHVGKTAVEMLQIGKVLPAVQRRDGAVLGGAEDGKMKLINVEVQNIEVRGHAPNLVEHQHVVGNDVPDRGVEAQGLGTARDEFGPGDRVSACKQRDVVTL